MNIDFPNVVSALVSIWAGFKGTGIAKRWVQEYISKNLVGATGPMGPPGPQGPAGESAPRTATEVNGCWGAQAKVEIPEADMLRSQNHALEMQLKLVVESRRQSAEQAEQLAKQLAEEKQAFERAKNGIEYFETRWRQASEKAGKLHEENLAHIRQTSLWKTRAEEMRSLLIRNRERRAGLQAELMHANATIDSLCASLERKTKGRPSK